VSHPVFNDVFDEEFGFQEKDAWHVVNVFNYGGLFTMPEPELASNFGIPWIEPPSVLDKTVFTNVRRDMVYQSFCTLAELCARGNQFDDYCAAAVEGDWETVKEIIHSDYLSDQQNE
jgi:hypothetical protein